MTEFNSKESIAWRNNDLCAFTLSLRQLTHNLVALTKFQGGCFLCVEGLEQNPIS